jgi:HAD superfamily hydrolase (TIGR01549 family)
MQPMMMVLLEKLKARLELEEDVDEVARIFQLANKEADRHYASKPAYLFRDYFEAIYVNFLACIGKPQLHSHFDWFEQTQREMLVGNMELQADCHETLSRLKEMGLYLSAVSNADENHLQPLVERGQLHRWLTHWTSSEAAQSCKPDRLFFEIALQKSGLAPEEVVFVGDSLEQDILGAHNVGLGTVLITEYDALAPMHTGREVPEPDYRITRLSELPGLIEGFSRRPSGN